MQGMKGLCETYEIIKKSSNCISYILSIYLQLDILKYLTKY